MPRGARAGSGGPHRDARRRAGGRLEHQDHHRSRAGDSDRDYPPTRGSTTTVPPAPGSSCGQTISVPARHQLGPGPPPLAVGDSVLYDAAQQLSNDGFDINAMVCRTMAQGVVWLEQHAARLPPIVVVALGTNGPVTTEQISQLLAIVGPQRMLALVTPHHGNYAYVPGLMRAVARQAPGRVIVLDWDRITVGHPDWFAPDGIHLGGTAGIDAFAELIAGSVLTAGPSTSTAPVPLPAPPATRRRQRAKPRQAPTGHRARPRARTAPSVGSVLTFLSPLLLEF